MRSALRTFNSKITQMSDAPASHPELSCSR
jgi:hypothetical protein